MGVGGGTDGQGDGLAVGGSIAVGVGVGRGVSVGVGVRAGAAAAGSQAQAENQRQGQSKKLLHGNQFLLTIRWYKIYLRRLSSFVDSQLKTDWITCTRMMMKMTVTTIMEVTRRW